MLKKISTLLLLTFSFALFSVQPYKYIAGMKICDFKNDFKSMKLQGKSRHLPQNLLVFRVQFSDVKFNLQGNTPDNLPHNYAYFEKYMEHLQEYLLDASHGLFSLNYTVMDSVITLDKPMGFYGDDEEWSSRIAQFVVDIIQKSDPLIDFSQYDSFMVFHAGAGQESDVTGNQKDDLWSTYITKSDLKEELAPDNDDWQGIQTDEGTFVKQMPILPETEWQPDYDSTNTNLGMMGVIAHEFGHELGLPTLFDNDSSNGRSAGVGNFGIMGTGAWNANGFVPPLPCAWSRYFLGWENPLEINNSKNNIQLTYPMSKTNYPKLVKINISDKEYFLLENRQENPDNSMLNDQDSFTFTLLEDGQLYYPAPYDNIPKFDFMTNSYRNCEWDFYLPGLGGPKIPAESDGSGILIWHIDENIIENNLSEDLEINSINGNSSHKGVDLEEADGIQQLDSYYPDTYMFGGPYDSYREGNNDYFGYSINPENDAISQPTSESYYGGIPFEITNISSSDSLMTFNVKFPWNLQTDYVGENPYPPNVISENNNEKIFYPMPDGTINTWIDTTQTNQIKIDSLASIYSYDEESKTYLIPTFENNIFAINKFTDSIMDTVFSVNNFKTNFPILIFPNSEEVYLDSNTVSAKAVVGLNNTTDETSELIFLNENCENAGNLLLSKKISSNLIFFENSLYFVTKDNDEKHFLTIANFANSDLTFHQMSMFDNNEKISSISFVPLNPESTLQNPEMIISTENKIYVSDLNGNISFKKDLNLNKSANPTFADIDNNGTLDILIGGENKFIALDYKGNVLNTQDEEITNPDTLGIAGGVIQINDGTKKFVVGNFSKNRFVKLANHSYINSFEICKNYPFTLRDLSRTLPVISEISGEIFAFIGTDNGDIARVDLGDGDLQTGWLSDFGDLKRSAVYHWKLPENNYETDGIFVKSQVNIYPVPFIQSINSVLNTIIKVNKTINVTLKIYDISGHCIFDETKRCYKDLLNKNAFEIPSNKYSSGVYFARFKAGNEYILRKFIIEK
jgi:M6 family metalloprotease-like protein